MEKRTRAEANRANAKKNSLSKQGRKNPMYGKKPWNYKGGTNKAKSGSRNVFYRKIIVNKIQIFEHRYLMEKFIGRKLNTNEVVHHINGNGLDNRIENLQLLTQSQHSKHHLCKKDSKGKFISSK